MTETRAIPYNPNIRAVRAILGFGIVLGILNLLPCFQSRLWLGAAIGFTAIAVLLFLRRSVWKRNLTVSHDCLVVPTGFLRLRPTRLAFAGIRQVWVTEIFGSAILRVRTIERDIEIQDIYLPDRTVFYELKRILETSALRARNEQRARSAD